MRRLERYDPVWAELFENEAQKIRSWLNEGPVAVHHIGSTAVPGMLAKPIIDILIEVQSIPALDSSNALFTADGYDARGEYGIAGRRYFSKTTGDGRGFHVHAYPAGHSEVFRHLAFRDYLKATPAVADAYAEHKRQFANADGVLAPDYQEAKGAWVIKAEREAMEHFQRP